MLKLDSTRATTFNDKAIVGGLIAVAVFAGWSYLEVKPKHDFQSMAGEAGKELPGARLISAFHAPLAA